MFRERILDKVHQDFNILVPDAIIANNHGLGKREHSDDGGDGDQPAAKRQRNSDNFVPGTKVMCLPSGAVPLWVEGTNLLRIWISFIIPKIEDVRILNNFGVSIQETHSPRYVQAVESKAAAFFDQISRYFLSRAKVVSKVAKYPHIEDYRRAVVELDEKE